MNYTRVFKVLDLHAKRQLLSDTDCRCNVLKLPPRATLTQSIFNGTKLPHPEV